MKEVKAECLLIPKFSFKGDQEHATKQIPNPGTFVYTNMHHSQALFPSRG